MEKIEIPLLLIAIATALYAYIQYGRQIPSGALKPRPFTWLIWGILSTCVSIIQIENGADLGTVGALLGAISGYVLAAMAWFYGSRKVYKTDIASLALAGAVLILWALAGDATAAVMATIVYVVGFTPTIVHAWKAPHKESQLPFAMSVLKYSISFLLLGSVTLETAVYPVVLALANLAFLIMVAVRRNEDINTVSVTQG